MKPQQDMEQQIWAYIDGVCSTDERNRIDKLLKINLDWKNKYRELLDVHQLLSDSETEQPSLRFTKNVMEEIARSQIAPATKNYINKKIIWGIAAFFIILIGGFLVYGFGQVNWSETGNTNLPIELDKVDYSRFFNNNVVNVFMMINVVLGLFLLDRFLANRRKSMHKEA